MKTVSMGLFGLLNLLIALAVVQCGPMSESPTPPTEINALDSVPAIITQM